MTTNDQVTVLREALYACRAASNSTAIYNIVQEALAALPTTGGGLVALPEPPPLPKPRKTTERGTPLFFVGDMLDYARAYALAAIAAPAPTGESLSVPHEMGYRSGGNHIATAYANGWNDCRATMLGEIPDDPSSDPAAKEST